MSEHRKNYKSLAVVDYKSIGTVSIDEMAQALWEDIKALQDLFGVRYVTGAKLIIPSTNEYGDPLVVKHPDGRILRRYDTHYYRPACMDYKL